MTTFGIGDITIHRIVEQEFPFFDPLDFLPNLTPELLAANRSWLEPDAIDPVTGKLVLCFQSYILRTPHHTILVDSCVGNHKHRPARPPWHMKTDEVYMSRLAELGLTVDDIDYVMCTHLHVDHVGWNTRLENGRWVPTFPRARYLFSQKEYTHWEAENAKVEIPHIADSVLPIVAARRADFIRSDFALDDHIRLLPTPGHTPDHFAVCVGHGHDDAVLIGDMLHSPIQVRYPEITMRADYDPAQAVTSRRSVLERYCDTDTLFCTGHFPSPSRGRITRWDDGFRYVPKT